ncbi:hypothetical protein [Dokdonella sp.]|uniref:hypothetical protein n=1 Tax=Dokdonella sp. TaxID=2291710 RepID=UPI002624EBE6|nr:hypothetical protein [Dokdonella sp.]
MRPAPRLPALLTALAFPFSCAVAQVSHPALDQPLPGDSGSTVRDLVRQIVPGLAEGDIVHALLPVRHVNGDPAAPEPLEDAPLGPVSLLPVQTGGRSRLLLLLDQNASAQDADGYAVLALFDANDARLLDAANVAWDRITAFHAGGKLAVASGEDVVLTLSEHFNSNQTYDTYAALGLRGDRIRLIGSLFTLSDRGCGYEHTQRPTFAATGPATARSIRVSVTDSVERDRMDCGEEKIPAARRRTIATTWRWDARNERYIVDPKAFERLEKENEQRL